MALVGDGELAVTKGVPQLDGSITRSRDNLAVVSREGNGQDVIVVADESAGGVSGSQFPQTEGLIPRAGESIGTIRGDDLLFDIILATRQNTPLVAIFFLFLLLPICAKSETGPRGISYTVRNDVRVSVEGSLWVSVCGIITGQVPDDQGLVATGRQKHVGTKLACQHHPSIIILPSFSLSVNELSWNCSLLLQRRRQAGNPAIVALEGSTED